jgi:hypothetical protein
MLKITSTVLICSAVLLPTFASASGCEAEYEAKLEQIDDRRFVRRVGNYATTAVIGVGAATAYTISVVASLGGTAAASVSPIIGMGALMTGGGASWGTHSLLQLFDREDKLETSYNAIKYINVTEEELRTAYHRKQVDEKVRYMNFERAQTGLTPLTDDEVTIISAKTPKNDRNYVSLDSIVWYANNRVSKELSFDEVRAILKSLNESKKLCPLKRNGKTKLLSPRQIGKLIAQEIE